MREFKYFEHMAHGAELIHYAGEFDSATVIALSVRLKAILKSENVDAGIKRRLFSSFIEMAQNVLHYGGTPVEANGAMRRPGAIGLGQDGVAYWIVCGNLVPVEQIPRITEKLNALRNMSLAEIKAAYREQLANDDHESSDTDSKGAGLGLLTIGRDSVHSIEFNFVDEPNSDGRLAYFYLKAVI